jgi:transcriptional regulator with XRE-family HTH domain
MPYTLKNRLKKLPAARRKKIIARSKQLIAEEMTLRDLRKSLELTQMKVGTRLHMKQEAISRLEKRSDMLLSTLFSYIKAMGGELNLTAKFPNRPAVKLYGFEDIAHRKLHI